MISFETEGGRFNHRVAGVAIRGGRVLLQRDPSQDFWTPPGGRVEFGETGAEALAREFAEETGATVEVGHLAWIAENHFECDGVRVHELLFVYAVEVPDDALTREVFMGQEGDTPLEFRWIDLSAERIDLRPNFLMLGLPKLPAFPFHVIQRS